MTKGTCRRLSVSRSAISLEDGTENEGLDIGLIPKKISKGIHALVQLSQEQYLRYSIDSENDDLFQSFNLYL
jgi:hypothetical protein